MLTYQHEKRSKKSNNKPKKMSRPCLKCFTVAQSRTANVDSRSQALAYFLNVLDARLGWQGVNKYAAQFKSHDHR